MELPRLPTTVHSHQASGPPNRELELDIRFRNPASFSICIVDSWITVDLSGGATIAKGDFLSIHGSTVPSSEEGYARLSIPLPPFVLRYIEHHRAGNDVELMITSRILAFELRGSNDATTMGRPLQTQFDTSQQGRIEYEIPQSDWIKLLRAMAWSDLELLEIPSRNLRSLPLPARALDRFDDAQDCHRRGQWEEAMSNCRKSIEALVKDVVGEDRMTEAPVALAQLLGEGPKTECLNDLLKSFAPYLHLARHEKHPALRINPEDAELAVHITGAVLAYLGSSSR